MKDPRASMFCAMTGSSKKVSRRQIESLPEAWSRIADQGWLGTVDAESRDRLRSIARLRDVAKGEFVYRVGDRPDGVYGLVSGLLDISIPRADGEEITIHRVEAGYWVGDLAMFAKHVRLASLCAIEDSRLVQLPQDKLISLVKSYPDLMTQFYSLTRKNFELALNILGNLSITPSDIRVALRLLLHDENVEPGERWIRLSHEDLAGMLALSLPTLQRALRRLEERKLIETGYRRIRVLDRAGLLRYCGDMTLEAVTA